MSSIVEVDAVDPRTADRLTTLLMASVADRGPGRRFLRAETAYDRERARMKVIVLGALGDTAWLLEHMEGALES